MNDDPNDTNGEDEDIDEGAANCDACHASICDGCDGCECADTRCDCDNTAAD